VNNNNSWTATRQAEPYNRACRPASTNAARIASDRKRLQALATDCHSTTRTPPLGAHTILWLQALRPASNCSGSGCALSRMRKTKVSHPRANTSGYMDLLLLCRSPVLSGMYTRYIYYVVVYPRSREGCHTLYEANTRANQIPA
jgi:hypothetical protein